MDTEDAFRLLGSYSSQLIDLRRAVAADEHATSQEHETLTRISDKIKQLSSLLRDAGAGDAALPDVSDLSLHVRIRAPSA